MNFFVLEAVNHLLVDPTYTLIEALCSVLFLFCSTLIHHIVSEVK